MSSVRTEPETVLTGPTRFRNKALDALRIHLIGQGVSAMLDGQGWARDIEIPGWDARSMTQTFGRFRSHGHRKVIEESRRDPSKPLVIFNLPQRFDKVEIDDTFVIVPLRDFIDHVLTDKDNA